MLGSRVSVWYMPRVSKGLWLGIQVQLGCQQTTRLAVIRLSNNARMPPTNASKSLHQVLGVDDAGGQWSDGNTRTRTRSKTSHGDGGGR
jgi:hypothetical protein